MSRRVLAVAATALVIGVPLALVVACWRVEAWGGLPWALYALVPGHDIVRDVWRA